MSSIPYVPTYRAFILRMWTEEDALEAAPESAWRFSLERIRAPEETPPERRGFVSTEELLTYLQVEMRTNLQNEVVNPD